MPHTSALAEEKPFTEEMSQERIKAFRDAEASLLLEGLDPTVDPGYLEVKAQLIGGTLSFDEARAAFKLQAKSRALVDSTSA